MPKTDTHYVVAMGADLARREVDYAKKNDTERSWAAHSMRDMVGKYLINDVRTAAYDLYPRAVKAVTKAGKASPALLQRQLHIPYEMADQLMIAMHKRGVIGPADGARPRGVFLQSKR